MYALEVKNLSKHFDNFSLKNINFNLEKGYIMGYVGQNGAGKTAGHAGRSPRPEPSAPQSHGSEPSSESPRPS